MTLEEILQKDEVAILTDNDLLSLIKGERGDDGKTPTREELIEIIKALIPAPVKGEKGEDGKDGKDADESRIVALVLKRIPKPKDGVDGKDGRTPIKGVDYFDGKDGSPDTGKEIVEKINKLELKPEFQIDASHIKNLPARQLGRARQISGSGEITKSYDLDPLLDGATKTFTIPVHRKIILVVGTSAPFRFLSTTDYTHTASSITFTDNVDAEISLAAGQGVTILYA